MLTTGRARNQRSALEIGTRKRSESAIRRASRGERRQGSAIRRRRAEGVAVVDRPRAVRGLIGGQTVGRRQQRRAIGQRAAVTAAASADVN